jgi:IS30 family transposase
MSRILNWITGDQRNQQPTRKRMFTPEEVLDIRTRRANGAKVKDLAKMMGASQYTISTMCCGLDYVECPGPVKHKKHRTLTEEDKRTIVALHGQGLSVYDIGRRLDRHPSVVSRVLRWVNIPGDKTTKTP